MFDFEIVMIFFIAIFTFIILNVLFKKLSMPVIVKRGIILCAIVGLSFMCIDYIEKREVENKKYLNNNFVIGRVEFVANSINKINIDYINSNIKCDGNAKFIVKLNSNTKILMKDSNNKQIQVKASDLKIGDIVTIYCSENIVNSSNPEITAIKIIKKDS